MALDPQKWSAKVAAALTTARETAILNQHSEIACLHVAVALVDDSEGIFKQVRSLRTVQSGL